MGSCVFSFGVVSVLFCCFVCRLGLCDCGFGVISVLWPNSRSGVLSVLLRFGFSGRFLWVLLCLVYSPAARVCDALVCVVGVSAAFVMWRLWILIAGAEGSVCVPGLMCWLVFGSAFWFLWCCRNVAAGSILDSFF